MLQLKSATCLALAVILSVGCEYAAAQIATERAYAVEFVAFGGERLSTDNPDHRADIQALIADQEAPFRHDGYQRFSLVLTNGWVNKLVDQYSQILRQLAESKGLSDSEHVNKWITSFGKQKLVMEYADRFNDKYAMYEFYYGESRGKKGCNAGQNCGNEWFAQMLRAAVENEARRYAEKIDDVARRRGAAR